MREENKTVWHQQRSEFIGVCAPFKIRALKILKISCRGSSWSDNVKVFVLHVWGFFWLCGLFCHVNPVLLWFCVAFSAVSCFLPPSYFEGPLCVCLLWLNTSLGGSFFCTWSLLTCLPRCIWTNVFHFLAFTSLGVSFFVPSASFGLCFGVGRAEGCISDYISKSAYPLKVRVFVWQWVSSVCLAASSASGAQKPCSARFPAQTWPKRGLFKLSGAKSRLHKRTALQL